MFTKAPNCHETEAIHADTTVKWNGYNQLFWTCAVFFLINIFSKFCRDCVWLIIVFRWTKSEFVELLRKVGYCYLELEILRSVEE